MTGGIYSTPTAQGDLGTVGFWHCEVKNVLWLMCRWNLVCCVFLWLRTLKWEEARSVVLKQCLLKSSTGYILKEMFKAIMRTACTVIFYISSWEKERDREREIVNVGSRASQAGFESWPHQLMWDLGWVSHLLRASDFSSVKRIIKISNLWDCCED